MICCPVIHPFAVFSIVIPSIPSIISPTHSIPFHPSLSNEQMDFFRHDRLDFSETNIYTDPVFCLYFLDFRELWGSPALFGVLLLARVGCLICVSLLVTITCTARQSTSTWGGLQSTFLFSPGAFEPLWQNISGVYRFVGFYGEKHIHRISSVKSWCINVLVVL